MAIPRVAKYVRIPSDLAAALEQTAQQEGVSENEIIIRALKAFLDKQKNEEGGH